MKPAPTPIAFTYKFLCGLVFANLSISVTPNPSFCFPVNLVPVRDHLRLLFPLSRTLLTEGKKKKTARGLSWLHAARWPSRVACGTLAFPGCMWHMYLVAESEGCCWLWRAGIPLWRRRLFRLALGERSSSCSTGLSSGAPGLAPLRTVKFLPDRD